MFVSALMAASILLAPQDRNPEIMIEIQTTTMAMLICDPVLPDSLWDSWLSLALEQGFTLRDVRSMRDYVAKTPAPFEVTEETCLDLVDDGVKKLKVMFDAERQR